MASFFTVEQFYGRTKNKNSVLKKLSKKKSYSLSIMNYFNAVRKVLLFFNNENKKSVSSENAFSTVFECFDCFRPRIMKRLKKTLKLL